MTQISAMDLRYVLARHPEAIVFDVRRRDEVERDPYIIPGALITTRVNLPVLVRSIPSASIVVFYAGGDTSCDFDPLGPVKDYVIARVLKGGLAEWRAAQLPLESLSRYRSASIPSAMGTSRFLSEEWY